MKPTIGRIVRYVASNGSHWPAIIHLINVDGSCDLTVFTARGPEIHLAISHGDRSNEWAWPAREGA
jgi:hypothetical protein